MLHPSSQRFNPYRNLMAYRRKQGIPRAATFKEEVHNRRQKDDDDDDVAKADLSPPSLAAQAIRASAAHRDSSLSNAYGDSAFYRDSSYSSFDNPPVRSKGFNSHETTSMSNESNSGFWGVLARKAKAILDDDNGTGSSNTSGSTTFQMRDSGSQPSDSVRRLENPRFRKGLDAITTSLNQIGDTFEKAFEAKPSWRIRLQISFKKLVNFKSEGKVGTPRHRIKYLAVIQRGSRFHPVNLQFKQLKKLNSKLHAT